MSARRLHPSISAGCPSDFLRGVGPLPVLFILHFFRCFEKNVPLAAPHPPCTW